MMPKPATWQDAPRDRFYLWRNAVWLGPRFRENPWWRRWLYLAIDRLETWWERADHWLRPSRRWWRDYHRWEGHVAAPNEMHVFIWREGSEADGYVWLAHIAGEHGRELCCMLSQENATELVRTVVIDPWVYYCGTEDPEAPHAVWYYYRKPTEEEKAHGPKSPAWFVWQGDVVTEPLTGVE